jgi:hypothetical protein
MYILGYMATNVEPVSKIIQIAQRKFNKIPHREKQYRKITYITSVSASKSFNSCILAILNSVSGAV